MLCSNDGILFFFCMNGIGYGKVLEKNYVVKIIFVLYFGGEIKGSWGCGVFNNLLILECIFF